MSLKAILILHRIMKVSLEAETMTFSTAVLATFISFIDPA